MAQAQEQGLLQREVFPRMDEKEVLRDSSGPYAVVGTHEIVVARRYVQSNGEVSAHKEAIERAADSEKDLLMYIDQDQEWKVFDPRELLGLEASWTNHRKGSEMLNFHVDEGQSVDIQGEI